MHKASARPHQQSKKRTNNGHKERIMCACSNACVSACMRVNCVPSLLVNRFPHNAVCLSPIYNARRNHEICMGNSAEICFPLISSPPTHLA